MTSLPLTSAATSSATVATSTGQAKARALPHQWRRDVIDGITRSIAIAALPSLALAFGARLLRGDYLLAAFAAATALVVSATLWHRLPERTRTTLLVAVFVWVNAVFVAFAREIPFNDILMPMGAIVALLVGGIRWAVWTLGIMAATWLVPFLALVLGRTPSLDIPWPSQYLRLLASDQP